MNIREAMGEAIAQHDTARVKRIVDHLRAFGLGPCPPMDYEDLFALAGRAKPGITKPEWDALLYEIDALEVRE